ncbi:formimidoylglutamase [Nocardia cyriacigeorgica]|uniref:Formimidoylglutamase n=1 Tax=Nocardia cyriacigeorgica TaxID=135487 RepID=A0A6P1DBT7_9NOCA|nr:formimidoylglutamase [Nocardia cyriacigeorgica]NEW38202.1 formimidoylglutamase [Nocardia cyriacigeorgica]NEW47041.1 formimidoylglutamase [Nocardia cyriacigeorgica]NEW52647.1 formimidoylglutamase [Nocardia cyriacigeorgica]NEW57651.1 formimidoylglutamase [Nocardia cyriacigeorgica]
MQPRWTGRTDGTAPEHLRWHQVVEPYESGVEPGACVFIGFASDEGVRRNKGRVGAAAGPDALRQALAPMALTEPHRAFDAGNVTVVDALDEGQRELGATVAELLDAGHFPIVLGGGHEIAYGTYLGVARSALRTSSTRVGILNLDAHFDLRADPVPSSGTPFRQILEADGGVRYAVLGISQPSNTAALFDTAAKFDVRYLLDDDCDQAAALTFVDGFLAEVDLVYLTIDLDVLPASVAPGVSAPAAFGIPLPTIQAVCDHVTASGKLAVVDVAELNPGLDIDNRTARTAARLIHRIGTRHMPLS